MRSFSKFFLVRAIRHSPHACVLAVGGTILVVAGLWFTYAAYSRLAWMIDAVLAFGIATVMLALAEEEMDR
jgi:hypothetical protein